MPLPPGPEASAGVPSPLSGTAPSSATSANRSPAIAAELLLQRRGGGVEVGVDGILAERGQRRLGGRYGGTRRVRAQHDVGARDRLLRRLGRSAAGRIGVVSANVGARRGEVGREPASCLAQTEHGNPRRSRLLLPFGPLEK